MPRRGIPCERWFVKFRWTASLSIYVVYVEHLYQLPIPRPPPLFGCIISFFAYCRWSDLATRLPINSPTLRYRRSPDDLAGELHKYAVVEREPRRVREMKHLPGSLVEYKSLPNWFITGWNNPKASKVKNKKNKTLRVGSWTGSEEKKKGVD